MPSGKHIATRNCSGMGANGGWGETGDTWAVRAVVLIVKVDVVAAFAVTDVGLKLQVAPAGRPVQDSETLPLNPPEGVIVSVVCVD